MPILATRGYWLHGRSKLASAGLRWLALASSQTAGKHARRSAFRTEGTIAHAGAAFLNGDGFVLRSSIESHMRISIILAQSPTADIILFFF